MFEFFNLKKQYKQNKSFEQLVNKKFLNLKNFNLKKIVQNINDIHNIFIENFIFLNDYKSKETNLIQNSYLLNEELKKQLDLKKNFYINSNYNDSNLLNNENILILNEPKKIKSISLEIKNYIVESFDIFNLTIEGINSEGNFVKIKQNVFPINYNGIYKEKIKINENFESIFESTNENIKVFDYIEQKEVNLKFEKNQNNKITINKNLIFNENLEIRYIPNYENIHIKEDLELIKVYLNTNYKENNIKKINLELEE